ncbi:hypothetical protein C8J57DRAFT_1722921 [Mycena rebaudengoi]|nr:hypothetical protein C8J57DRAFT_1722921 [Mycena rebaudengoi]
MAKSTSSHTLQVVTFTTPLPISTVLTRLDTEIAKTASGPPALTAGVELQKELEARVHSVVGPNGFVYFSEIDFGALLQFHTKARPPRAVVYVIGNPLIVQSILQHSLRAAHHGTPIHRAAHGRLDTVRADDEVRCKLLAGDVVTIGASKS